MSPNVTFSPQSARGLRIRSDLILLLVAIIWGSGFIAQRVAAQNFGVFLFNGARFLLGALILIPFTRFRWNISRPMLRWVILAGVFLFGGATLQQAGMVTTTAGNAGFITGTYVVLVPILLVIFWRQKIGWNSWLAALLALTGTLFLSTGGKLNALAPGDILEFMGAILWALHVILVGKVINHVDVLQFAIGQYIVCGLLNLLLGLIFETNTLPGLANAWWTVVYAGIFSVSIGFTLQGVGQRHAPPTDASIILGLEAVFAAAFGFLLLNEAFSAVQQLGCGLIFVGIVLAQIRPAPKQALRPSDIKATKLEPLN
jgi:drug/metabolite transporter (DMT)-like permease